MTEYEKECEALEIVKKANREGRIEYPGSDHNWHKSTYILDGYRIEPEPKKVPLELKDWAGGPWWVRPDKDTHWWAIDELANAALYIRCRGRICFRDIVDGWQRTKDFVKIEPCYKTE